MSSYTTLFTWLHRASRRKSSLVESTEPLGLPADADDVAVISHTATTLDELSSVGAIAPPGEALLDEGGDALTARNQPHYDAGDSALDTNSAPAEADTLIAPAALDSRHFRDGDKVQFGYDRGGPAGVVLRAEPDDQGLLGVWLFGSDSRAAVCNLVHLHGCSPCQEFMAAWAANEDRSFASFRDTFTAEALSLADHLCDDGLIAVSSAGRASGHGDRYVLSPAASLPEWLHDALKDAVLTAAEGPWPNWARTNQPVDWPTLVDRHPETLAPDDQMLQSNQGATWPAIAEAFTLLRSVDPEAFMDVSLWVGTYGRILVEPTWIGTTFDLPATVATAVDGILTASGRPGEYIHDRGGVEPDTTSGWMVSC